VRRGRRGTQRCGRRATEAAAASFALQEDRREQVIEGAADLIGVGLQNLYLGFFGAVRNRLAHQDFRYASYKEAFQSLMLLDYLTENLDEAAARLGKQLA
jgi:hypothetical protein